MGSGIHESVDGGKTWKRLTATAANGLPRGTMGRIDMDWCKTNPKVIYAQIEVASDKEPRNPAAEAAAAAAGGGGGRGGRGGGGGAATTSAPNRREVTVTVTLASGEKVEGRLGRIDDFIVTLTQADGTARSFRRDGDLPRIDIRDPLEAHKKLLLVYTNTDMHNVTAFLATLK